MTPTQSQPFPGVPEQLIYKKNTPPAPKQTCKQSGYFDKSSEEQDQFKVKDNALSVHKLAGPCLFLLTLLKEITVLFRNTTEAAYCMCGFTSSTYILEAHTIIPSLPPPPPPKYTNICTSFYFFFL